MDTPSHHPNPPNPEVPQEFRPETISRNAPLVPPSAVSIDRPWVGLMLCVLSALGYSAVNACLRKLTVEYDRIWIIFVKESVTVAVIGPWLLCQALRGRRVFPSLGAVLAIVLAGIVTQVSGNLPAIWALSVIGLAVTMPVMSGTNMVATAILGRIFLGERVSQRTMVSIGLLLISIVLLSLGAGKANLAIAATAAVATGSFWVTLAFAGAVLAGCSYSIFVVIVRRNVTSATPVSTILFIVTGMGTVILGPWAAMQSGLDTLVEIPWPDLGLIILAGFVNLGAFLSLTNGLKSTPAAKANLISTSQVAIGTVIGMSLFAERVGPWMILGVCLTVAGMLLIGPEVPKEPETPETPI